MGAAKWAVKKIARLTEPAVFLPLAVPLLPFHPQWSNRDRGKTVDAALGVRTLFDSVARRTRHLVKPRGIRDEGPDRLRRQGEMPFLAVAIDGLHRVFVSAFVRFRARSVDTYYTRASGYGFVISPSRYLPILQLGRMIL